VGDHAELVAAEAREGDAAVRGELQPGRKCAEQRIAVRMPERVVDLLEPVEIEQQDGEVIALVGCERLLEAGLEERAVRETCECIVQRLVLDHVHLSPQPSRRCGEDREQQDVEPEEHELQDADDR
jgi:hypothetical protein